MITDNGAVELGPALRQGFLDKTAEFGGKAALRCLALALRQLPHGSRQVGGRCPFDAEVWREQSFRVDRQGPRFWGSSTKGRPYPSKL